MLSCSCCLLRTCSCYLVDFVQLLHWSVSVLSNSFFNCCFCSCYLVVRVQLVHWSICLAAATLCCSCNDHLVVCVDIVCWSVLPSSCFPLLFAQALLLEMFLSSRFSKHLIENVKATLLEFYFSLLSQILSVLVSKAELKNTNKS